MTQNSLIGLTCVIVFGIIGLQLPAEQEKSSEDSGYDRYKIIYEQNIFSKYRRSAQDNQDSVSVSRKKSVVLSLYVLKGVVVNGDQRIAFVEEQVSGQSMRIRVGDELLAGRITEIQVDGVLFAEQGQARRVAIGDLFGKTETITMESVLDAPKTKPSVETLKIDLPADTDGDLLKKMMERRKSEVGK